jgi:hypothetical protein
VADARKRHMVHPYSGFGLLFDDRFHGFHGIAPFSPAGVLKMNARGHPAIE